MQKLISTVTLCALCAFAAVAPTWAQDAEKPAAETTKKIEKPQPAASIMDAAYMKAKKEHKPILVMFHATWCGWCKRLEAVMDKPEFKKMFASNYVLVNLDVMENGAKKETDENAGGIDLMKEWGGEKSGLPFYVFLDEKGKKIADSNVMPKGMNIGYPGEPDEIVEFNKLIEKTAPKWKEKDRKKLIDYFVANAPKPTGH